MKEWQLDLTLWDAGALDIVNTLIDDGKLTWMPDEQALDAASWHLVLEAMSYDLSINFESMQAFILHGQRAGKLHGEFVEDNFCEVALSTVPVNPPIAPPSLGLSVTGAVVTGSAPLGQVCDGYEWQGQLACTGPWLNLGAGTITDLATVVFQASNVPVGTHKFRVIGKWGFFVGFPGNPVEVTVV